LELSAGVVVATCRARKQSSEGGHHGHANRGGGEGGHEEERHGRRVASSNASNRRAGRYLPSLARRISRLTTGELRDEGPALGGHHGRGLPQTPRAWSSSWRSAGSLRPPRRSPTDAAFAATARRVHDRARRSSTCAPTSPPAGRPRCAGTPPPRRRGRFSDADVASGARARATSLTAVSSSGASATTPPRRTCPSPGRTPELRARGPVGLPGRFEAAPPVLDRLEPPFCVKRISDTNVGIALPSCSRCLSAEDRQPAVAGRGRPASPA